MGVTFFAELTEQADSYVATCGCPRAVALQGTYEEVAAAALARPDEAPRQPLPGCQYPDYCVHFNLYVVAAADLESDERNVDVSMGNARVLLEALGLSEASGQLPAADLLGRVLVALALAPQDAGIPSRWEGRVLEGGRSAGWLQQRLTQLQGLAEWCAEQRLAVCWG